jgi:ribonucleoside-diphosphate reductase beta chain
MIKRLRDIYIILAQFCGSCLERIGLKPLFRSKNPFPWMSETIDLNKEKNFFETRVNEYQSASNLTWN